MGRLEILYLILLDHHLNPLLKNKNVVLSPHAATFTQECLSKMSIETVQNIIDFFEGKLNKNSIVKI